MDTETIAKSTIGKLYIKVLAAGMESRFRYRFFGPMKILRGADILPGQIVLEVGCGTGYFTLPAAPMLPLSRLLPEMHRVLKAVGSLAVWPPIPGWLPQAIIQSGLFAFTSKRNGVHNFRRC